MSESKWERLLEAEARPRPIVEQLVEEAGKLLARELSGPFLPESFSLEEREAARFAPLFESPRERPSEEAFRGAFQLARLELTHALEAHQRYLEAHPLPERDRLARQLLARWLAEQLYALKEQLRTPLPRVRLLEILDAAERRL